MVRESCSLVSGVFLWLELQRENVAAYDERSTNNVSENKLVLLENMTR